MRKSNRNDISRGPVTAKSLKDEAGFTLVELLVVIAIIALLMAILLPALGRAREMGKRAVCMSQMKQLQIAWSFYCEDNKEKVPIGDTWFSWNFPGPGDDVPQLAWCEYPHQPINHAMPPNKATNQSTSLSYAAAAAAPDEVWWHAIEEGTMWKYVKDHKVYKCPVGDKGHRVTYYMSQSLHDYPTSGGTAAQPAPVIRLRSQIRNTYARFVFLDVGDFKEGAFYVPYTANGALWWGNLPPTRHGVGTDFVFVDGHVEYRKWTDPHARKAIADGGWMSPSVGPGNDDCDLRWMCQITWGSVPYSNPTPGKKCEY